MSRCGAGEAALFLRSPVVARLQRNRRTRESRGVASTGRGAGVSAAVSSVDQTSQSLVGGSGVRETAGAAARVRAVRARLASVRGLPKVLRVEPAARRRGTRRRRA